MQNLELVWKFWTPWCPENSYQFKRGLPKNSVQTFFNSENLILAGSFCIFSIIFFVVPFKTSNCMLKLEHN